MGTLSPGIAFTACLLFKKQNRWLELLKDNSCEKCESLTFMFDFIKAGCVSVTHPSFIDEDLFDTLIEFDNTYYQNWYQLRDTPVKNYNLAYADKKITQSLIDEKLISGAVTRVTSNADIDKLTINPIRVADIDKKPRLIIKDNRWTIIMQLPFLVSMTSSL